MPSTMLSAAAVSFGVVFLAELGDRSQPMARSYALRYQWWRCSPASRRPRWWCTASPSPSDTSLGPSSPHAPHRFLRGFGVPCLRDLDVTREQRKRRRRTSDRPHDPFRLPGDHFLIHSGGAWRQDDAGHGRTRQRPSAERRVARREDGHGVR
ncbi:TMEM165/GDT1 family protein [Mycobacterium sp. CBMA271]|nr:TMEM165/GDT1 family protein [Mycobacteroides sp. CBMA 271]